MVDLRQRRSIIELMDFHNTMPPRSRWQARPYGGRRMRGECGEPGEGVEAPGLQKASGEGE